MPSTSSALLKSAHVLSIVLLGFVLPILARPAISQDTASAGSHAEVAGSVSVTNKGISTTSGSTLGKPAVIFDLSIRHRDLSFEPQFRFGLDGKPWAFLFWGRYKLLEREKLRINIGAHPALALRVMPVASNGTPREVIVARRYVAGELYPSYSLTRNIRVGAYYLYSYGAEQGVTKHTQFAASRVSLTNVGISDRYFVRLDPQLSYLRTDDRVGFYLNSGFTLAKRNLPLSVSAVVNKPVRTSVPGGEHFLWNVSLNYSID
jgi:hypothetical protein